MGLGRVARVAAAANRPPSDHRLPWPYRHRAAPQVRNHEIRSAVTQIEDDVVAGQSASTLPRSRCLGHRVRDSGQWGAPSHKVWNAVLCRHDAATDGGEDRLVESVEA